MRGIYQLLAITNTAVSLFVLLLFTVVPIQMMRNYFEGIQYDVAWSAGPGGLLQALVIIIGIGVLQRWPMLPSWMGPTFQWSIGILCFVSGLVWLIKDWHTQWADRYHHIGCFPLQLFLLVTLLFVIAIKGTKFEIGATICLLLLFVFLFVVDVKQNRLSQRDFIRQRVGATFRN